MSTGSLETLPLMGFGLRDAEFLKNAHGKNGRIGLRGIGVALRFVFTMPMRSKWTYIWRLFYIVIGEQLYADQFRRSPGIDLWKRWTAILALEKTGDFACGLASSVISAVLQRNRLTSEYLLDGIYKYWLGRVIFSPYWTLEKSYSIGSYLQEYTTGTGQKAFSRRLNGKLVKIVEARRRISDLRFPSSETIRVFEMKGSISPNGVICSALWFPKYQADKFWRNYLCCSDSDLGSFVIWIEPANLLIRFMMKQKPWGACFDPNQEE